MKPFATQARVWADETVIRALVAVDPRAVALMVVVPAPTAITKPLPLTVATPGLLLTQFVTWLFNLTFDTLEYDSNAVAFWPPPTSMVVLGTLTLLKLRNAPGLVFTTFAPRPSLTIICSGVSGPFQIRTSSMDPLKIGSPSYNPRPIQERTLLILARSIVVEVVLTSTPLA